uniref:Uncharacterized protein n=2 Tax=Octactis speculum TaxID=3111310 RepID=A0A7S2GE32_9STRA
MDCRNKTECVKYIIFSALIVFCVIFSDFIVEKIEAAVEWASDVPISVMLSSFALIMFLRRMVPIFWYTFPSGPVMVLYLISKFKVLNAVLVYQAMKCTCDIISVRMIHYVYRDAINRFFASPDDEFSVAKKCPCIPKVVFKVLLILDEHWAERLQLQVAARQKYLTAVAFGSCWSVDEEVMLYWFSTRASISKNLYSLSIVTYSLLNIPIMLIRAHAYVTTVKAVRNEGGFLVFTQELFGAAWWRVLLVLLVAVPATIYVHGSHIILVYRRLIEPLLGRWSTDSQSTTSSQPEDEEKGEGNQRNSPVIELAREIKETDAANNTTLASGQLDLQRLQRREERRARLLEEQARDITHKTYSKTMVGITTRV